MPQTVYGMPNRPDQPLDATPVDVRGPLPHLSPVHPGEIQPHQRPGALPHEPSHLIRRPRNHHDGRGGELTVAARRTRHDFGRVTSMHERAGDAEGGELAFGGLAEQHGVGDQPWADDHQDIPHDPRHYRTCRL